MKYHTHIRSVPKLIYNQSANKFIELVAHNEILTHSSESTDADIYSNNPRMIKYVPAIISIKK